MPIVRVNELKPGMTLAADVKNFDDRVLLFQGAELTEKHIAIFKSWGVTEVHAMEDPEPLSSDQEIDLQDLAEAQGKAAKLFCRTNQGHSAVKEMLHLCALNKLNRKTLRRVAHAN